MEKCLNIRLNMRGKQLPRNLSPYDKVRAIQRIRNGETKASVSRDIRVPESTLRGWCKNEHKLRFLCHQIKPKFLLENSPPEEKKRKLDIKNTFNRATKMNGMPCLKNFIEVPNLNHEDALFEDMDASLLPIAVTEINLHEINSSSTSILKGKFHKSSSSKKENENSVETSPIDHDFDKFTDQMSTFDVNTGAALQSHFCLESTKNGSYNKNLKMEEKGYIDCEDDFNDNGFTKPMQGISIDKFNNDICSENYNHHVSMLLLWYNTFNASLSYLALKAAAASFQDPVIYSHDANSSTSNKNRSKKLCAKPFISVFGLRTLPFPNSMSNDCYYNSEPEDLSIRSTSFTTTSNHGKCQRQAKSTGSEFFA